MIFKEEYMRGQYETRSFDLRSICDDFCRLSEYFGIEPVVTRILDQVDGSSGVHEAGRGVDFRDESLGKRLYSDNQAALITAMINLKYARRDGKPTCLHHSFNKGPVHFHLQSPSEILKFVDYEKLFVKTVIG
jgi:hypothetical protein